MGDETSANRVRYLLLCRRVWVLAVAFEQIVNHSTSDLVWRATLGADLFHFVHDILLENTRVVAACIVIVIVSSINLRSLKSTFVDDFQPGWALEFLHSNAYMFSLLACGRHRLGYPTAKPAPI